MQNKIVLVSGLSNSGKSSFADFLETESNFTHVPLDKYFKPVPSNTTFLEWVQQPLSLDWELLDQHLNLLIQGIDIYSPAFDPWDSGLRLSTGGAGFHPRNRLMKSSRMFYVVPGCLAFEFPLQNHQIIRVFIDTPLEVVASRHTGKKVSTANVDEVLTRCITNNYHQILEYREQAEFIFDGEASFELRLKYLDKLLEVLR